MHYADDFVLYSPVSDQENFLTIHSHLDSFEKWSQNQYLHLNPVKCKYMLLSRRRLPLTSASILHLCGSVLEQVQSFKYLGILITTILSWSDHIDGMCRKARRVLGLIYRQFFGGCLPDIFRQLYLTIV